jgi:hypothetical protein
MSVLVAVGLYVLIRSGLMRIVTPFFRDFGEIVEDVSSNESATETAQAHVQFLRDTMFDGRMNWLLNIFVLPLSIKSAFRPQRSNIGPHELQKKIVIADMIWLAGHIAQRPIAGVLLIFQFLIIAAITAIRKGTLEGMRGLLVNKTLHRRGTLRA